MNHFKHCHALKRLLKEIFWAIVFAAIIAAGPINYFWSMKP
jgi:hypothetical protein